MIKKIAIAGLCLALGSSLNAKDMSASDAFIGLEAGYAEVQGDRFSELDYTGKDVAYGFRIGAQNDEWRTTFIYDYYDSSSDEQNIEMVLFTFDYFLMNSNTSLTKSAFKPYIGANVGYSNYESTSIDSNGVLYGAQAGFVINVMEAVDIDFGYRYSLSSANALDHVGNVVFGINYLY